MKTILDVFLSIAFVGFMFVGVLLFTNHSGFAIKITNYLFFILFVGIIYERFYKK